MRYIKKKILGTVAAVLAIGMIAGCGGGSPSNAGGSGGGGVAGSGADTLGGKTEITLWTAQRADFAIRERKLNEFNAANPDLEVKMEIYTEDYLSTLELSFVSRQAPDIFQVADNHAKYFVERDMMYPLDEFITPEFAARFGDLYGVETVNMVDGSIYTLPERGVTYRLLYNQDIFDQAGIPGPPQTLEEVYEYAKRVTEWGKDQGIYGFGIQLKTPFSVGERVMDQLSFRNNIPAYDYKTGTYDFTVMKPIVEVFQRMYAEGIMFPGAEGLEIDPLRTQFAAGNVAMYFNGSWEPTLYMPEGQFPSEYNWNSVPLPGIGTTNPVGKTNIGNAGRSWAISSTCKDPAAAWRYIEFLLSDEYLTEYQEGGYGLIIVPSVVQNAKAPDIHGYESFMMNDKLETIWPVRPDTSGLVLEGRNAYDTYVAIILGAANIDTALSELNDRYNGAVERAIRNGDMEPMLAPDFDPTR